MHIPIADWDETDTVDGVATDGICAAVSYSRRAYNFRHDAEASTCELGGGLSDQRGCARHRTGPQAGYEKEDSPFYCLS